MHRLRLAVTVEVDGQHLEDTSIGLVVDGSPSFLGGLKGGRMKGKAAAGKGVARDAADTIKKTDGDLFAGGVGALRDDPQALSVVGTALQGDSYMAADGAMDQDGCFPVDSGQVQEI